MNGRRTSRKLKTQEVGSKENITSLRRFNVEGIKGTLTPYAVNIRKMEKQQKRASCIFTRRNSTAMEVSSKRRSLVTTGISSPRLAVDGLQTHRPKKSQTESRALFPNIPDPILCQLNQNTPQQTERSLAYEKLVERCEAQEQHINTLLHLVQKPQEQCFISQSSPFQLPVTNRCTQQLQHIKQLVVKNSILEQELKIKSRAQRQLSKQFEELQHSHRMLQSQHDTVLKLNMQLQQQLELNKIMMADQEAQLARMSSMSVSSQLLTDYQQKLIRLNSDNIVYKTRLSQISKDFCQRVIQERYLIELIDKLDKEANQSRNRMLKQLEGDSENHTFLRHLFLKNEDMLQELIGQLKVQLSIGHSQAKCYRKTIEELRVRCEDGEAKLNQQGQNVLSCQQRADKYLQQMKKIRIENCISCNEFVGYANQLSMILTAIRQGMQIHD